MLQTVNIPFAINKYCRERQIDERSSFFAGIHITVYYNWEEALIYTCKPLGKQTIWGKHWRLHESKIHCITHVYPWHVLLSMLVVVDVCQRPPPPPLPHPVLSVGAEPKSPEHCQTWHHKLKICWLQLKSLVPKGLNIITLLVGK